MQVNNFEDQLTRELPRLRRFAFGLCGNSSDADDLVQLACEKALTNKDKWEDGTRMDSWMYRIIQNLHIDGIRTQERRKVHCDDYSLFQSGSSCGEAKVENKLLLLNTMKAMEELPEDQRAVLLLISVEGMSYKETADILEIPNGTVMSRLTRARKALVERMQISIKEKRHA